MCQIFWCVFTFIALNVKAEGKACDFHFTYKVWLDLFPSIMAAALLHYPLPSPIPRVMMTIVSTQTDSP